MVMSFYLKNCALFRIGQYFTLEDIFAYNWPFYQNFQEKSYFF